MKESIYNRFYEKNGKKYVFNCYSCAFAEINDDFFVELNNVKKNKLYEGESEVFDNMCKGGIILPNDVSEIDELKTSIEKEYYRNVALKVTIIPTLKCNFSCPYCYENKRIGRMSDVIVQETIDFIKKQANETDVIQLSWYGGEPLLEKQIIQKISEEIIAYCDNKGKKYTAAMVTNGYFVDEDTVKLLINAKILSCQVTLDGIRDTHNKKRFIKGTRLIGSFDKIVENIKLLTKANISVSIRINVDKNNSGEIEDLLKFLHKEKLGKLKINFGWLNPITEVCSEIENECLTYEQYCSSLLKWQRLLVKYGFEKDLFEFYPKQANVCSVISEVAYTINPKGDIYKCWDDIEDESKALGNVGDVTFTRESVYSNWSPLNYEKCRKCDVLPLCLGMCPYLAIRDNAPHCVKWKYILDEYLQLLI